MIALLLAATAFGQDDKIVNGIEVTGSDFPEVVAVQGNGSICTGSLIHPEWVLTAAHCWDSVDISNVPNGNGSVFFGNNVSGGGTRISVAEVIVHPTYWSIGFSPNAQQEGVDGTRDDISLLRLSEPATTQLMALNETEIDDTWIGSQVTFIGYGITAFQGSGSGIKRYTTSFIDSYDDFDRVFAFDRENGNSTCQGDSGGPGVIYEGNAYIQFSVTAFGTACGSSPGGHMRVDAYVSWIRSILAPFGADITTVAASPPDFVCSHQLNPEDENSIALGVVPMDLRCEVLTNDPTTIRNVAWSWGDGNTDETTDLRAMHTYNEQGVYNLSACITTDQGGTEVEQCVTKTNHVNACGVPEAAFEATPAEGLAVDLLNRTPLRAYTCISNATWEVFEGPTADGDPIRTLSGWEPELELAEEGPGEYTILLNVGGLGGTGAAVTTVKVGRSGGCAYVPGWSWTFLAPMFLVGLSRRRD